MLNKFYDKISAKILIRMLILLAITGVAVSVLTLINLRGVYERNANTRVLISNDMILPLIDGDEVKYYADLMRNQDDAFKQRQYQFLMDRMELYRLQEQGASEEEQANVISRIEAFKQELSAFKSEKYWNMIDELKKHQETSRLKYVYVMVDTGVVSPDGVALNTYLFDAEDSALNSKPHVDGLGTVEISEEGINDIYITKKQLDKVFYYNAAPYGELYCAYSPILDSDGEMVAILGTDLELNEMHRETSKSMIVFNAAFLAFMGLTILIIYIFIRRSITKPLGDLIGTAQKLHEGDVSASVPKDALSQKSELGELARIINDMGAVYQSMTTNRAILDSNPFACIIFDMKMDIIDCNPRALELYQFESLKDLAKGYRELLEESIPGHQPDGHKSMTLADRVETVMDRGYCEFETQLDFYGHPVMLNTIMKLIEYKKKKAIIVYQFDLTTQKEIQKAIKYNSDLLQAISNVANVLLAAQPENFESTLFEAVDIIGRATSVDRVYVWKNRTAEDGKLHCTQICEWSPDTEPQQNNELTVDIAYEESIPTWEEPFLNGRSVKGLVKDMEIEEQNQLSPQGIISILVTPITIQDKLWGFVGFDDCTNERAFTKEEEDVLRICGFMVMTIYDAIKNELAMNLMAAKENALVTARAKSNFLANMSHEIRTPLNAILGMVELILIEDTTPVVSSHAMTIKNACRSLLAIINDILDISKIESGKLEIVPARYQFSSLLSDVISIIKIKADAKDLPFIVNVDAGLPSELYGDEIRIKQIIINILSNAIKFTKEGNMALSISGDIVDRHILMKFTVADTGIGIKETDIDNLFGMFQQIDPRKNRSIEGTGLGLSISKQLAEMMGGFIAVESEYGVGSTFTAIIRQDIVDDSPAAALINPPKYPVVIYENRSECQSSIITALDNLGCRYKICADSSELSEHLGKVKCEYIFVASFNLQKVDAIVLEKQSNAVIISVFIQGGIPVECGARSVSMPIHSLQVACVLNDESEITKGRSGDKRAYSFTAPDAKVLVVDDNAVNLKVASGLLKAYDIQADTASSGGAALEMVQKTRYDLVFMDHMMPEMDGVDTTRAIRRLGGEYADLPIIALTANVISGVRQIFLDEGLDDYLAKPIEIAKLDEILVKWIPKEIQRAKDSAEEPEVRLEDTGNLIIAGLNTDIGIERSGGMRDSYIEILEVYASEAVTTLNSLIECHEKGDIKLLTTYAHGIKSASANIGAEDVSRMAAGLEAAGKSGDADYINKNVKPFAKALSGIIHNIDEFLAGAREKPAEHLGQADMGLLKDSLAEISDSLKSVDIEAIEDVLNRLAQYNWDENVVSALDTIKDSLRAFDYDGMETAVTELQAICG